MSNKEKIMEFLVSQTGRIVMTVVGAVIIYGILMAAMSSNSTGILTITMLVCVYFGWTALNRITPQIFVWMSITGWIIYFLIKGFLAVIVGAFVAPFQISKMIAASVSEALVRQYERK